MTAASRQRFNPWPRTDGPTTSLARDHRRATRWYVLDGVGAVLLETADPHAAWRCLCDHPRAASEVDEHGRVLANACRWSDRATARAAGMAGEAE